MKFQIDKERLVNPSPIGVIMLHFLYTIERLGKSQNLLDASYSAKGVVVFHNPSVEDKKLLKMYRRHYLMMIIYLLFISCLYI